MAVFDSLQIAVDFGYSLNFKKKRTVIKKIVENGGTVSYIVTRKCHFVITSETEKQNVSMKCRMAIKYGLPVLQLDYISDCLQAEKLLQYDSYIVGGSSKVLDFQSGKITAGHSTDKSKKFKTKTTFNPRAVKTWIEGDKNQPWKDYDHFEVAKYSIFTGFNSRLKSQYTVVIELHAASTDTHTRPETIMETSQQETKADYRVVTQSGPHKDLEAGKPCHTEVRYLPTVEQALAVYAMVYEDTEKKPEMSKCQSIIRGVGSHKLQKLIAEVINISSNCTEEVKELVEHLWTEAVDEITSVFGDIKNIKLEEVEKAEAVLLKVRDALKSASPEKVIEDLVAEFYVLLPHKNESSSGVPDARKWLFKKLNMCQLIRDILAVSEMTDYETRAQVEAKYAALRCRISHLSGNEKDEVEQKIMSSLENPVPDLHIANVFEVWRQVEDLEFRHDIDRKELLFHSSKVENFVGILSRGLLLPKIVEEDLGGKRTDAGMLGSGIYFASDASTSVKYSSPSKTKGSRLLLVNEVALGTVKDYTKFDTSLMAPPDGFNSTHGVSKKRDKNSEFEDDEYVVYAVNQQRIRYLVEFTVKGDRIKPLPGIATCETASSKETSAENTSLHDVTNVKDPISKIKPGLIGTGSQEVELRCVHIRAKLIDLAAQVVVLQEYYNNSQQAIEAKYVFPLEDTAAVCGFEAFINGKHIVGKVKEKETAHKEYKEAINKGHGAYLMDQDEETPDVFTVSVGNLTPGACVLIKITYVAELQIEDEQISFYLPATVAPWKEETTLKQFTQEQLTSLKLSAVKTTVQIAVEMPFEIRTLHSPTHKIRIKQTASLAYVEMVASQDFGAGFQLLIGLAEIHVPHMWVERNPEDREHQACMLTFFPQFETKDVVDGEIILVLDASNSMKGTSLSEAKKVALLVLNNLPSGWNFNVIRFGSDYEELFPVPRSNTEENKQSAVDFVQSTTANLGQSDVMRLLRPLFLLPLSDSQRNVFLVSDGYLNDEKLVLQYARQHARHTRLFTFGVSSTGNVYTLKALSRLSGGAFEFFNSRIKSKWENKVKSQVSKASQPGLTSVSVEWRQYNDNPPPLVQAPRQITSLFSGSHLVIYGFVPDCTMAVLTAKVDGQEVSTVVSTSELSITEGQLVHRLTARAIIRDWDDGVLSEDRTNHEVARMNLKNYIIDLSKEYSIVTKFTSFIAVEERDEKENVVKEGPTIQELINKENVDTLNYMGWTKVPVDDSLTMLTTIEELSAEIKKESFSNKMIYQIQELTEIYQKLREIVGPCNEDVLKSAILVAEAHCHAGNGDKAADLAETTLGESVQKMVALTEDPNYPRIADILVSLRDKVTESKGTEQTLDICIPFPPTGGMVLVTTPSGRELKVACHNFTTIKQLKNLLLEQEPTLNLGELELLHHRRSLKDETSLRQTGVGHGGKLNLAIRPQPERRGMGMGGRFRRRAVHTEDIVYASEMFEMQDSDLHQDLLQSQEFEDVASDAYVGHYNLYSSEIARDKRLALVQRHFAREHSSPLSNQIKQTCRIQAMPRSDKHDFPLDHEGRLEDLDQMQEIKEENLGLHFAAKKLKKAKKYSAPSQSVSFASRKEPLSASMAPDTLMYEPPPPPLPARIIRTPGAPPQLPPLQSASARCLPMRLSCMKQHQSLLFHQGQTSELMTPHLEEPIQQHFFHQTPAGWVPPPPPQPQLAAGSQPMNFLSEAQSRTPIDDFIIPTARFDPTILSQDAELGKGDSTGNNDYIPAFGSLDLSGSQGGSGGFGAQTASSIISLGAERRLGMSMYKKASNARTLTPRPAAELDLSSSPSSSSSSEMPRAKQTVIDTSSSSALFGTLQTKTETLSNSALFGAPQKVGHSKHSHRNVESVRDSRAIEAQPISASNLVEHSHLAGLEAREKGGSFSSSGLFGLGSSHVTAESPCSSSHFGASPKPAEHFTHLNLSAGQDINPITQPFSQKFEAPPPGTSFRGSAPRAQSGFTSAQPAQPFGSLAASSGPMRKSFLQPLASSSAAVTTRSPVSAACTPPVEQSSPSSFPALSLKQSLSREVRRASLADKSQNLGLTTSIFIADSPSLPEEFRATKREGYSKMSARHGQSLVLAPKKADARRSRTAEEEVEEVSSFLLDDVYEAGSSFLLDDVGKSDSFLDSVPQLLSYVHFGEELSESLNAEESFKSRFQRYVMEREEEDHQKSLLLEKSPRHLEATLDRDRNNFEPMSTEDLAKLLEYQRENGSWDLNDHLDELFSIPSEECKKILVSSGIRSLGSAVAEDIQSLVATLLVLYSILHGLDCDYFLEDQNTPVKLEQIVRHCWIEISEETWSRFCPDTNRKEELKQALGRACAFCLRIEGLYPLACSTLELGRNWVAALTTLIELLSNHKPFFVS